MDSSGVENVVRSGMGSVAVSAHAVCVGTIMVSVMVSVSVAEAICRATMLFAAMLFATMRILLRNFFPLEFVDERYYFGNGFVECFGYFVPYFGCVE